MESCIISIHALRGEGDKEQRDNYKAQADISIHALRGEGDFATKKTLSGAIRFQSTPSVGRATKIAREIGKYIGISIHALRGEGDENSRRNH